MVVVCVMVGSTALCLAWERHLLIVFSAGAHGRQMWSLYTCISVRPTTAATR